MQHKYKENETQRDNYYSQQVRDRKQKAIEENEKIFEDIKKFVFKFLDF